MMMSCWRILSGDSSVTFNIYHETRTLTLPHTCHQHQESVEYIHCHLLEYQCEQSLCTTMTKMILMLKLIMYLDVTWQTLNEHWFPVRIILRDWSVDQELNKLFESWSLLILNLFWSVCSVLLNDLATIHLVPPLHLLLLITLVTVEEELVSVGRQQSLQRISGSQPAEVSLHSSVQVEWTSESRSPNLKWNHGN